MVARKLKIGLLGCGTVGGGLVELVSKNSSLIRQRAGVELSITKILVRDPVKDRPGVERSLLTTQSEKVLNNGCDMVVELVGGIEPARTFIQRSLASGKHVVTANKALLALDGFSLMKAAELQKVRLGFEASVCGGIPIIRALRNGLVGNQIQSLTGILNGTCNYILSRMTEDRVEFDVALAEAQAKGFAEADPTLDIDGHDAAQKLKILAELAFHSRVDAHAVKTEGIRHITADDIQAARELGCVIKHIASAAVADDGITIEVRPVLLPASHQLAGVRDENNAVLVRGDAVGEMLFSGKGAGSLPSASAVLSDIVDIACHKGGFSASFGGELRTVAPDHSARYYLRFPVNDPSAIGPITNILERNGIGVARAAAVWAKSISTQNQVRVLTQPGARAVIEAALSDITTGGFEKGQSIALPLWE
ncbi:MAG TPA: homoserine dehydrogenase [Bryobacteraceae bacterium]|jgi:homoserine dehydrogenase|nr:homoserine dehydrogenase [Bryobacteraceae bacterium]